MYSDDVIVISRNFGNGFNNVYESYTASEGLGLPSSHQSSHSLVQSAHSLGMRSTIWDT